MANKPLLGPRKTRDDKKLHWEGSSEHLRKALDLSKLVTRRLQVMAVAICVAMALIVVRLYSIQMLNTEAYEQKLATYTRRYQTVTTPRGEMLDRNGQVLVGNKQRLNITYFPPQNMTTDKAWDLAERFSQDFNVDETQLKTRDLKDLYLSLHRSEIYAERITDEEKAAYKAGTLTDNDIYYLELERITQDDLATLDTELRKAYVVKQAMDLPSSGQTKIIKSDVTVEEAAYLIEHMEDYQGFNVEFDWDREYPFGTMLKSVLGSVTTSKQGLPAEDLDYYLALDYSRNDKVGRSGLEKQYEGLLSGKRSVYDLEYDENGSGYLSEVNQGSKGYDLELSIDATLQQKLDEILARVLLENKDDPLRKYMNQISYVLEDPNTGDILAMSCMILNEDGTVSSSPTNIYASSYPSGSVVKGATVYMGLDQGVIQIGEKILDSYIKIKDTPIKKSWKTLGWVDDVQALAQSSNVFMFNVAIRLGGGQYIENGPLSIDPSAFSLMRNYYSQFGLGIETGLDIPNEAIGLTAKVQQAGNIMDFAIGQYDTYTPIQLAQYISTVANGGRRLQPRLVRKAYGPGTQNVVYENYVNVLSTVDNKEALDRVRQGFNACVYGGICYGLNSLPVTVSAKTGTAETFIRETDEEGNDNIVYTTVNSTVAYAPSENPEYAMACVIPNAWITGSGSQTNLCLGITRDLINAIYAPDPISPEVSEPSTITDPSAENAENDTSTGNHPVTAPTETPSLPPAQDPEEGLDPSGTPQG